MRPIGIDLFAGVGGLSLGFEQAGFDVVAAVEIDPIHSAIHQYNFPDTKVICKSVTELSGDDILRACGVFDKEIDVVFGGPPCQGFSLIGKRELSDPRNSLVHHFVRIVGELSPRYFVFENVKGLTVGEPKALLEDVIKAFNALGYQIIQPYQVLNAADYGVPQDRRRLFLVGARSDCPIPRYPKPVSRVTVWDAIGDLPEVELFPELIRRNWVEASYGKPSVYASSLRGIKRLPKDFSYPRTFNSGVLTDSIRSEHSLSSRQRFADAPFGKIEPISRFHKLDPNGVCNTIRAGTARDRGAFTSPRPIHPYSSRCITVREAARLHSYPDWFRFHVTKWHGFRQIGNSVPPLLAKAVASEILKSLGVKPTRPSKIIAPQDDSLLYISMNNACERFGVDNDVIPKRARVEDNKELVLC